MQAVRGRVSPVDGLTPRYLGAGTGAQVLGRQRGLQDRYEALQGKAGRGGVGGGQRVAVLPAAQLVRVDGPERGAGSRAALLRNGVPLPRHREPGPH
nr:MAG TPA: hypothetical protein [Caudoviricetes sp.]